MNNHTNPDITDAACLHIVHILQHPISCPTTKSAQTTVVNAPIMNFSTRLAGRYGKLTKRSPKTHHQANEGKSGLEEQRVRALGALRSIRSKKKLAAQKRREMYFLSHEEKEKWIEHYVERQTAGA
jgi:hypothetical protein